MPPTTVLCELPLPPESLARQSYDEALQTARTIQHYFIKQSIPSEILTEIRSAYKQLTEGGDGAVVIRPSLAYGNGVDFAKRLTREHGVAAIPISPFLNEDEEPGPVVRFCFAKKDDTLTRAAERLVRV